MDVLKNNPITGEDTQGPITREDVAPGVADRNYVHEQAVPTNTWTINHNMGKVPSVRIVDSIGRDVSGDIENVGDGTTTIVLRFSAGFSGKAYCN